MKAYLEDTIASISTPSGNGGISIVRISGKDSLAILEKIFKSNINYDKVESHKIHYGFIHDNNTKVDEVLVSIMLSPKTYTTEDVIEINCHGGSIAPSRILSLVLKNGARLSEPGEFTKRAFLNGRIDLSQAEAVMDLINAKTDIQYKASLSQLEGALSKTVIALREEILTMMASIEASIDYPEHDMEHDNYEMVFDKTNYILDKLNNLINSANKGKIINDGITTVILGKPNVGKSSLLNSLTMEETAIVTDIAGTTRDTLTEYVNIHGIPLKIIDTAGIRNTDDTVEQIGVSKSRNIAKQANLILFVLDGSRELSDEDYEILEISKNTKTIFIINKTDLPQQLDIAVLKKYAEPENIISLSLIKEESLDILYDRLKDIFLDGEVIGNNENLITNIRHKNALENSYSSLERVLEGLNLAMPEDLLAIDLRLSYDQLGEILGETLEDQLIDKIFSSFCLGK